MKFDKRQCLRYFQCGCSCVHVVYECVEIKIVFITIDVCGYFEIDRYQIVNVEKYCN